MLTAGQLIWTSMRPLIRLILCVSFGIGLTKADLFPPAAARGAGQIILNITMPCLLFSKIVPAFTSSNIAALGPLVLVALLYIVIGSVLAALVRTFFWVPHRFRYGILVAGGYSNWGDIPTAVVLSICASPPFNGTKDSDLAVAYVSVFILVFSITLFPLGASRLVFMDYDGPDVEDEDVRAVAAARRRALFSGRWKSLIRTRPSPKSELSPGDLDHAEKADATSPTEEKCADSAPLPTLSLGDAVQAEPSLVVHRPHKHVAFSAPPSEVDPETRTPTAFSPGPSRAQSPEHSRASTHVDASASASASPPPAPARQRPAVRAFHLFRTVVRSACTPVSFAVLVALLIGLVPALKALFVASPTGPQLRPAPDGLPPLSVLLDTASFVGAGSVPLGLVCLGGALARLQVPRGAAAWARTPAGAIVALAIAKELVLPVLGVLIVEGLTKAGVISAEDRVLRFVCMLFSCLPTATTQVYLAQVASGTGDAGALGTFLVPQYVLMLVAMPALTAYALGVLF